MYFCVDISIYEKQIGKLGLKREKGTVKVYSIKNYRGLFEKGEISSMYSKGVLDSKTLKSAGNKTCQTVGSCLEMVHK